MAYGSPPNDIFHNGKWYRRTGDPFNGADVAVRSANIAAVKPPSAAIGLSAITATKPLSYPLLLSMEPI